jgi:hypothetical protein
MLATRCLLIEIKIFHNGIIHKAGRRNSLDKLFFVLLAFWVFSYFFTH